MKKLILASGNVGKLREIRAILGRPGCQVPTPTARDSAGSGRNDALPYFIECKHNLRGPSEHQRERGPMNCSDVGGKRKLRRRRSAAAADSVSRADYAAGNALQLSRVAERSCVEPRRPALRGNRTWHINCSDFTITIN